MDDRAALVAIIAFLLFAGYLAWQPSAPSRPIHAGSTTTPVIFLGPH